MFSRLSSVAASLLLIASAAFGAPANSPRDSTDGLILAPVEGTVIAPGQAFDFLYDVHADYGVSSYNFTVWLLTGPASSAGPIMSADTTGHFFGRFSYPNYPGNPSPKNVAPAQLVMPNFSTNPGGFGAGASAQNAPFYIAVVEEWANGSGTVGLRIHTAMNRIVYNGTAV